MAKKNKSGAKGKGLDFKQLAIEHGEKAVLGVVALIVLLILGVGTHWASYTATTPEELDEKIKTAAVTIEASDWPEEKREEYAQHSDGRALREKVEQMMAGIEVSHWLYPPMTFPLYRTQEPIQEPTLIPVDALVADAGHALFEFRPEGSEHDDQLLAAENMEDYESADGLGPGGTRPGQVIEDDFTAVRNQRRGIGDETDEYAGANRPGVRGTGAMPDPTAGLGMEYGYDGEYGGMGMQQTINAQGMRYVSVRGLYPVLQQVKEFAKALQVEDESRAYDYIELHDFVIERQTAQGGGDPWSGPWEKLELDLAMDVLMKAADFDPDVVDSAYINPVITMPIPTRLMGIPDSKATHPRIRVLDQKAIEEQLKLNEEIRKYYEEHGLDATGRPVPTRPGGFASVQVNIGRMRDQVMGDSEGYSQIMQRMAGPTNRPGPRGARPQNLQMQFSSARDHLLFRYFDFTVEPGNAYRYRVSLVMRNPNYERNLSEVAHPSVVEGEFRTTEPSKPTPPVVVPRDAEYYLTQITPPTAWSPGSAWMDLFQWYPESGTRIRGHLKMDIGDFIGGRTRDKVKVVRPAEQTLEEEDVNDAKKFPKPPFSTDDMLVDVARTVNVAAEDHPDLPAEVRNQLRQADKVLVVDKSGELKILDPQSTRRAHQRAKLIQDKLYEEWSFLEVRQPQGGLDEMMMMDEEYYQQEMMMQGGRQGRGRGRGARNPIRATPGMP